MAFSTVFIGIPNHPALKKWAWNFEQFKTRSFMSWWNCRGFQFKQVNSWGKVKVKHFLMSLPALIAATAVVSADLAAQGSEICRSFYQFIHKNAELQQPSWKCRNTLRPSASPTKLKLTNWNHLFYNDSLFKCSCWSNNLEKVNWKHWQQFGLNVISTCNSKLISLKSISIIVELDPGPESSWKTQNLKAVRQHIEYVLLWRSVVKYVAHCLQMDVRMLTDDD